MYPHELSQGMRQRVALARTLATDPKLILADEPFAALDAQTKLQVQDSFLSEWEEDRRTVLLVTHDLQEAILLSDRVIVMAGQPGRVVVDQVVDIPRPRNGRLVEILTSEKLRALAFDLFHALDESSMP
jgi:NitT/TauT family transport system ATP-binding protein